MYKPISIESLSASQIQKLLKGLNVRVKHLSGVSGGGHTIHITDKQRKAIMKAYAKGSSHTLGFDPYQMVEHQGDGIFAKAFKFLAPHAVRLLRPLIKKGVKFVAGKKTAERVDSGIKHLSPLAIMAGEHFISNYEDSPSSDASPDGGALYPAGYYGGALNPAGYGVMSSGKSRSSKTNKIGSKRRGRGGGALVAAGYGVGGDGIFDFLDPKKNGVAKAFDPKKNGVAAAFDPEKNGVKAGVVKYGKKLASALIHKGIPAVAGLVGTEFGSPMLGAMAGKFVADKIGDATGYGVKRKGRFVKGSQEAKDYMKALRDRKK